MKHSKAYLGLIIFCIGIISSATAQMEIMTYNIKYANENDGENSWSNRKEHLTNQLKFYEPGIFGLQEALLSQLEHIKNNLKGYDFIGEGRDGDTAGEYTAIFYDTRKFEHLASGTFWLSETPSQPSKGWDAAYPRICTYAKFREQKSGKEFWVFNTHFDHRGDVARKESSHMIVSKVAAINEEGLPVIVMGDLNLEPETRDVQYLSEHFQDSKDISELVFGPEGTFNAYEFKTPVTRRIDYIFLSKNDFEVTKYAVLSDSKDLRYPSDHLPVLVHLQLK